MYKQFCLPGQALLLKADILVLVLGWFSLTMSDVRVQRDPCLIAETMGGASVIVSIPKMLGLFVTPLPPQ